MSAARKLVEPYQPYIEETAAPVKRTPGPKPKAKRRRIPATMKICLMAACGVVLGLLYLQQQVTSYYLNMEVSRLQEQVKLMEQRNDHLVISLESQRSLRQVEQIARTQLGMVDAEYTAALVVPRHSGPVPEVEARWLADQPQDNPSGGILAALTAVLNKVLPLGGVEAGTVQR